MAQIQTCLQEPTFLGRFSIHWNVTTSVRYLNFSDTLHITYLSLQSTAISKAMGLSL
jgi:hypothetical protein